MAINLESFKPGLFIGNISNLFSIGATDKTDDTSYECKVFNADKTLTILTAVEGAKGVHFGTVSEQNIILLPYCPNKNLFVELGGDQDVLSGVFSGCFMTKYKKPKASDYCFAHVDTGDTKYSKAFFSCHERSEFSVCFRPSLLGDVTQKQAPLKSGMKLPRGLEMRDNRNLDGCLGIITASNEAYRIFVAPVRDTVANTALLVILSHPEQMMAMNPEDMTFRK